MPDASFAGVQDTYLWICGARRRCSTASAAAGRATSTPRLSPTAQQHGITRGGMSVAVQSMVDARVAGVMFTLNPVSGDRSSIAIDASYGLGVIGRRRRGDARLVPRLEGDARDRAQRRSARRRSSASPDPAAATTVTRDVSEERQRAGRASSDEEIGALVELGRRVEAPLRPARRTSSGRSTADSASCSCSRPGPRPCGAASRAHSRSTGDAMALITAAMTRRRGTAEGMSGLARAHRRRT